MKASVFAKVACTACLSAACFMGLAACSGDENAQNAGSGLVAATVNGEEISEDKITEYINSVRAQMALDTDDAWGEWLVTAGYTPESLREMIVESYVDQELVRQGALSKGITADTATIDSYVNTMKAYYNSEEEWQSALAANGLTEEEYRSSIELSLLQQGLNESFAVTEDPTEEELVQSLSLYATMFEGAKRSSHILFAADDTATAQDVLNKINNGELDFAAAAKEYSQDTASAVDGGNVGLDALTTFVDEYQNALDELGEGEVSGLVESSYGIHIIKCTLEFHVPEEITASSQFPQEIVDAVAGVVTSNKQNEAYSSWLSDYRDSADIVINPIPESVSYNIDMAPYLSDEDESSDGENVDVDGAGSDAAGSDADNSSSADADGAGAEGAVSDGTDSAASPNGADEDDVTTADSASSDQK